MRGRGESIEKEVPCSITIERFSRLISIKLGVKAGEIRQHSLERRFQQTYDQIHHEKKGNTP